MSGSDITIVNDIPIPDSLELVTAEWLNAALRASTTIHASTVTALKLEPFGVGRSVVCRLARIRPTYDVLESTAPRSIILKLNDVDASGRPSFSSLNAGEVGFYTHIAPTTTLGSPHCYHAAFDEVSGRSVLLLEDLAELRTADWFEGLAAADAETVVRHIAGFHAAWWESPRLAEFGWLRRLDGPQMPDLYRKALERARTELPSGTDEIEKKTLENFEFMRREVGSPPRTILHNDLHAQNLFFGVEAGRPELVLIDFNSTAQARGPCDIAGLLGTSMDSRERLATESTLLRTYHSTLLQAGVSSYSLERCLNDYRFGLLFRYARTLLTMATGLPARNQREEQYRVLLGRLRAAIDDNDCAALLPS